MTKEIATVMTNAQTAEDIMEEFEKWKEEFAEKNGFYIPCIHDSLFFEELDERKKSAKSD